MPLDRRETRDWLRPGGPTCLRPDPTPQYTERMDLKTHIVLSWAPACGLEPRRGHGINQSPITIPCYPR
uniref:Uncharacterized protein n=1 Tax=Mesocestoides corti TaxID=53468 RepID=A0A5K3FAZ5_MESCO